MWVFSRDFRVNFGREGQKQSKSPYCMFGSSNVGVVW